MAGERIHTGIRLVFVVLLAIGFYVTLTLVLGPRADAAPASPNVFELDQPDGGSFAARQFGDEWYNGVETKAGYTVLETRGGSWNYAVKTPEGSLRSSARVAGEDFPPDVKKHLRDEQKLMQAEHASHEAINSPQLLHPFTSSSLAGEASQVVQEDALVILAQFNDQASLGSTAQDWAGNFFGTTDSLKDYYEEVSYGNFSISSAAETSGVVDDGVVGWVTLDMNHPNTSTVGAGSREVTDAAVGAADSFVDFADFDSNNDGYISSSELHITVVLAGYEAAYAPPPSDGKLVWAHTSAFSENPPEADGKVIGALSHHGLYTQVGEFHGEQVGETTHRHLATIGVLVHQLGYELDWPALYDFDPSDSAPSAGVGGWSVMGFGGWLHTEGEFAGATPGHPDAWLKWEQGWTEPERVEGTTNLSLGAASTNPDVAQLLDNPNGVDWDFGTDGSGEYFLVENRQPTPGSYDEGLPGCGLLIWHIDESQPDNANDDRRLVDLEEGDGYDELDEPVGSYYSSLGDDGDPYTSDTYTVAFYGATYPNSDLYGSIRSGVSVLDIPSFLQ